MPNVMEMNTAPIRRVRRSPDQMIADLQSQIATVKARAERAKVKARPTPRRTPLIREIGSSRAVPPAQLVPATSDLPPDSLDAKIQSCIHAFSVDIVELIQRSTLDAVQRALSGLAVPGGDSTDNEPKFGLVHVQVPRPFDLMALRRPVSRTRTKPHRSSKVASSTSPTDAPLSFEYYERMAIERALAESDGDPLVAARQLKLGKSTIYRRMMKLGIPVPSEGRTLAISPDDLLVGAGEPLSLAAYEKAAVLRALDQCDDNIVAAGKLLKAGKSTLYRRMVALGIPRPGHKRAPKLT